MRISSTTTRRDRDGPRAARRVRFAVRAGRWWACAVVAAAIGAASAPAVAASDAEVVVLRLDGSIQPGSARYLERGLAEAARREAALVVVEIDTPGGTLVSLRQMTAALTASRSPVAIYVSPAGARAASAGFFLLLAADVAGMAPGTNTGAAHPVALGGTDGGETGPKEAKAVNDAAAFARSLAAQRGRPPDLAEEAVRGSRAYSDREALAAKLIDVVASSRSALLDQLDGRSIRRFDGRTQSLGLATRSEIAVGPTRGERLLMIVADPNIAYLLLMLGLIGVAVELFHPGFVLPGAVGALALLVALYAFSVLPFSFLGLALLGLGLGFLVVEAFVTSFGLLAVAGLACFVLGSLMLFGGRASGLGIGLAVVLPVAAVVGATTLLLVTKAARAQRAPSRSGTQALVGLEGDVIVPLAPAGVVTVGGEYWQAVAPTALPRGTHVRVVGAEGRRLSVEQAEVES